MTAYPPDWQVHHSSQIVGFGTPTFADADIVALLCVTVFPTGLLAGDIRISLSGSVLLCTPAPLQSILSLPAPFDSYTFRYDVPLHDATPRPNMTTSEWLDFATLLRRRTVLLFDDAGNPVEVDTILPLLTEVGTRKTVVGASLRWAVAATPAGHLVLRLQAIPLPASLIPPSMTVDNTVTTSIIDFPLITELFDGSHLSGPVPTFFSTDPTAARAALAADPRAAHALIIRVHKRFLLMSSRTPRRSPGTSGSISVPPVAPRRLEAPPTWSVRPLRNDPAQRIPCVGPLSLKPVSLPITHVHRVF